MHECNWYFNIKCAVTDGKAYLKREHNKSKACEGGCHTCQAFLGVDPADIGNEYFKGCCDEDQLKQAA